MPRFELEHYSSPEDQRFFEVLMIELAIELEEHNGFTSEHIGLTENLDKAISLLVEQGYVLKYVHKSCESEKQCAPSNPNRKIHITCVAFTYGTSDLSTYHLGYVGFGAEDKEWVKARVAKIIERSATVGGAD